MLRHCLLPKRSRTKQAAGLRSKVLQAQATVHEQLNWEMPFGRTFTWYVGLFMVALQQMQGKGWLQRARLFQLVMLQHTDGRFRMSQSLANLLRAGEPEQPLEVEPMPFYSLQALLSSTPAKLYENEKATDGFPYHAESVWATMCALALYDSIMLHEWVENPQDPAKYRITIGQRAQKWVDQISGAGDGKLKHIMEDAQAEADQLVEEWHKRFIRDVQQLHQVIDAKEAAKVVQRTPMQHIKQQLRDITSRARSFFKLFLSSHPLLALWMTPYSAQLSRAERIILEVNKNLMMLTLVICFSYSRATICCMERKEYLCCPDASNPESVCVGFDSCGVLSDSGFGDQMLPEEMKGGDIDQCDAFPRSTLIGRLYATMVIVVVLLPVNTILQSLFMMSTNTPIPGFWRPVPVTGKKTSKMFGPMTAILVKSVVTYAAAMFNNFERFNKAMAMIIVAALTTLFNPNQKTQRAFRMMMESFKKIRARAYRSVFGTALRLPSRSSRSSRGSMKDHYSWGTAEVYVVPAINGEFEKLGYLFLFLFWFTLLWLLLTTLTLIRNSMGKHAERVLLTRWIMTVVTENFGMTAVQLIFFKIFGVFVVDKVKSALLTNFELETWYEDVVITYLERQWDTVRNDGNQKDRGREISSENEQPIDG
ncbi:hypothetical protein CYMTET_27482 [Cymbomonas tetramitiformis]|uniref:Uncharacterized protein n=2 Tax=Cymbomonas tetramitiformis TaxID=36881 RepID=A0AAE0KWX2_9CHLO|nr:hypothetical protein CYMTET_27482 [Cymbomonas tetramitiformis]